MIQTTNAVILRSTIFRETSQLLTFLTQDFGKIHTLAKGVRRRPNRFGTTFQPFTCNRIVFYERSRSNFQLLSQCDLINPFPSIRADLKKTATAAYFTELVDRVTEPGDKSSRMYRLLLQALQELSTGERIQETARTFEAKLLSLSGVMPEWADLKTLPLSKGTLRYLKQMISSPWETACRIRISQGCGTELKDVLKRFIDSHLEEKIYSRDFLEELERL